MKDKMKNEKGNDFTDRGLFGISGEKLSEDTEDGIFSLDWEWRFSHVNEKAAYIAGKRVYDLIGKVIWEEYPSLIGTELESAYRAAMEKRVIRRFEMRGVNTGAWYNIFAIPSAEGIMAYWQDISAQKKQEEALRFQANILKIMDDAVIAFDPCQRITYWSPGAQKMYGWTAEEALGRTSAEILRPLQYETETLEDKEERQASFRRGEPVKGENVQRRKDGTEFWVEYHAQAFFDSKGVVAGFVTIQRDVSERKEAEEALRDSEEKYRLLFENMTEMFQILELIFDDEGKAADFRYIQINDASAKLGNMKKEDMEGKTAKELWGTVEDYWLEMLGKVLKTGESTHMENYSRELDAYYDLYAWKASECRVAIVFSNITEKKNTEEALRGNARQLEEANRQKEDILESISDCFYALDKDLRFTYVNRAAEEIWGIARADLLGRGIENVFPGLIDISLSKFRQVLEDQVPQHYEVFSKVALKWGDMSVYPTRDGISVYFHDTTERKRAEEALRESEERQRYLLKLSDALRPLSDAQAIQTAASRILAEHLKVSQANYAEYHEDLGYSIIRQEKLIDTDKSVLGVYKSEDFSYFLDPLRAGSDLVIPDISLLSGCPEDQLANIAELGFRAHLSVPLIKDKEFVATLTVRQVDSREWTQQEISLLHETAERTWAAVERARAEEALRERESKLRAVLEALPAAVLITDPTGQTIDASRALQEVWGENAPLTAPELYKEYRGWWPETGKRLKAHEWPLARSVRGETVRNAVIKIESFDGKRKFIRADSSPVTGPHGESYGAVAINEDITERKLAEEAIAAERQRLYGVLEGLPVMVCLLTPDYHIPFANGAFRRKFGEPGGRRCYEFCFGKDKPCEICESFKPLETGKPQHWENVTPDGSVIDIYDHPFTDADGSPLILEMDIEITERKRAEAALRESEEKYRELVENSPAGIYEIDFRTGKLTSVNDAMCAITGYSREEMLDMAATEILGEESRVKFGQRMKQWLSGEEPDENVDYKIITKDGREIIALLNVKFMRDEKGNPLGASVVGYDITERKKAEEALRESEKKAHELIKELEEADRSKNQFISVLSHELRNPLAAISAGVDLIDISGDIRQHEKAKEIMKRQMKQFKKLIDDLLDISRITQNKIVLKKETIVLNETVRNTAADFKPEFEKRGIRLYTRIERRPVILSADAVRIAQIIGNLLSNSLKFTQKGGAVWLALTQKKNDAVITVKDNGAGISAEIMSKIFEPFTQAEQALDRREGGLGLGLFIVKGIAELHGGNVTAFSEGPGKGSEFTIRLPVLEKE